MHKAYAVIFSMACLLCINTLSAQRAGPVSDSLWCDHLEEIIKCASTDLITDRIATGITDSAFIPVMKPLLRLSTSTTEYIGKQYNKVDYACYLYSADSTGAKLEKQFAACEQKVKACLSLWEEARLKNTDPFLSAVPDDYFFTNSEDETTVRLDILHDQGYHIRLHIY